jgi:hypothetical protein
MKVEFTYHDRYLDIALEHYKEISILQKELDDIRQRLSKAGESSSNKMTDLIAAKYDRIGHLALIVVVFCALSAEAFINNYAIASLSKSYLESYLDKLDLFSKWIVIPRITTRKQLDPGSKALQDLDWLITLRNKLIHYKSKLIEVGEIKETDFLWEEDAKRAVETARNLVTRLGGIDSRVSVTWLRLAQE